MRSYREANSVLGNRDSRKLENNTYLKRRDTETIAVLLHATDVVTYHADGRVVLNSGSWKTVTTKDRINKYSPIYVRQENGIWYIGNEVYADYVTYYPDGHISGTGPSDSVEKEKRKQVKQFAKNYIREFINGRIPKVSRGDCLYCSALTEDGRPLCEHTRSNHLSMHIEEQYYVPSLLWNAITFERNGCSPIAYSYAYYRLFGQLPPGAVASYGNLDGFIERQLTEQLRRYLCHCLSLVDR